MPSKPRARSKAATGPRPAEKPADAESSQSAPEARPELLARNLLRAADFLPFGFGFAIVSMLTRRDCKRLGDIAAATLVVHEARAVPRIEVEPVPPVVPVRPLAQHDEAAIVALAARANRLTKARLDELAALAAPVTGDAGRSGAEVTRRVLGVAQWVLGQR